MALVIKGHFEFKGVFPLGEYQESCQQQPFPQKIPARIYLYCHEEQSGKALDEKGHTWVWQSSGLE